MGKSFVALYRGPTVSSAELVAVCTDLKMVRELADKMLMEAEEPESDAALEELKRGRRRALQLVKDEAGV